VGKDPFLYCICLLVSYFWVAFLGSTDLGFLSLDCADNNPLACLKKASRVWFEWFANPANFTVLMKLY